MKPALQKHFSCYTGVADIYVYFYERGFQLLREDGILTYISSNKYFRSGYGRKLRRFLGSKSTVHQLIDFGDAPVFEAIAYPSIIILGKRQSNANQTRALNWEPGPPIEEFDSVFRAKNFMIPQKELTADGWRLESPAVLRLLEKLRKAGKALGEYVNGRFYRGIVTGLNEAFVVDRTTRDRLIAEHPSSAEILKPFLIGQDMKRWSSHTSVVRYVLFVPWHFPLHDDRGITGASKAAENEFKRRYPAAYDHLLRFKRQLEARNRDETGKRYEWYALQRCAATYHLEFEKTKIVWGNLAKKPQFTFAEAGCYINAPANLMVSDSKYLLGILNSKITQYLVSQSAAERQGGFLEFKPMYISPLAIPEQPKDEELSRLVDQILAVKRADPAADVSALEREIDWLVYQLYGLTKEEIEIIEESVGR